MIRPEVLAGLRRWREVGFAAAIGAFGLWLIALGGYFLAPVGAGFAALGAVIAVMALRRMRFAQPGTGPGLVEVDEGQIGYMGPGFGGFVALPDMQELRLMTLRGQRLWRLKQADGQVLLIPVQASGAERLFDAFATLPGMDMPALLAALDPPVGPAGRAMALVHDGSVIGPVIWRRPAQVVLT